MGVDIVSKMIEDVIIPELGALDPSQDDYVARLDEDFSLLVGLAEGLEKKLANRLKRREEGLVVHMAEWGFPLKPEQISHDKFNTILVEYKNDDPDHCREIDREVDRFADREGMEYFAPLRLQARDVKWAIEDYSRSILSLTKIETLKDGGPNQQIAHFFYVRGNDVFEAHLNIDEAAFTSPVKNPNISRYAFANKHSGELGARMERIDGNVYLIKNPSKALDPEPLMHVAMERKYSKILDERKEAMSPAQKLILSMKSGVRNLGKMLANYRKADAYSG